jgi:HD-GYP domain-containing protein (c-di-GMP phosphodiesterase class II)
MKQDSLDYFLHALGALFRMRRMYPPGKKQVAQAAKQTIQRLADWGRPVRITLLGNDTIIESRRLGVLPLSFQHFFQALRQSGCDSVQIEADAGEEDLLAWIEHVISKERSPYRSPKIIAGALSLEKPSQPPEVLAQAVSGYLGFLSQTQEAISELESNKTEGLVRAREIVCAIAARLAVGKGLFEPIHELKNFDDYTFTHALNVCMLSSALARAIKVPSEWVNAISLAALCHDLGKKEVPKEVLNKRGPLEPEERALMQNHPAHGARLLLNIPGVESENSLLPVVAYQHHMAADQSGYPKPPAPLSPYGRHFASLLVAVVDVFDALRTIRPYRPALSVAKASTILLGDAISGKLHKEYVSTFLSLLQTLVPGRRVVLSDGSRARILEAGSGSALAPIVETEEGCVYILSDPSVPQLSKIEEEGMEKNSSSPMDTPSPSFPPP